MRSPSSLILMVLAMADSLYLMFNIPFDIFLYVYDIDITESHILMCKLYIWVVTSVDTTANLLIIVSTIFRVIAVYLPHKVNIYCSRRRALLAIILVVVSLLFYRIDYFSKRFFGILMRIESYVTLPMKL